MTKLRPFKVPGTFLDNTKNPSWKEADVAVFGIAFDATASYNKGAWFGPDSIMAASHQIEYEVPAYGVPLTDKINPHSLGVLEYPRQLKNGLWVEWPHAKLESLCNEMVQDTKEVAKRILQENKLLIGFGGEHSTANGIFQALAEQFSPKEITLVHLDAHLDLREALEELHYSHGSVIKRGIELGFNSIHIGIRDHISGEEAQTIRSQKLSSRIFPCPTMPQAYYKNGSGVFEKKNFLWKGIFSQETIEQILELVSTRFAYFSIDVDAFDPAFFPGTGTPLPFGLDFSSTQDFFYQLFQHLKQKKTRLLGFDIQEVAPQLEKTAKEYCALQAFSTQTEMNAALLAYKLLLWNFSERFQ